MTSPEFFKKLSIANVAYAALLLTLSASQAERIDVGWEDAGAAIRTGRDSERRVQIIPGGAQGIQLVDQHSNPPSPFVGQVPALFVQSTETDSFWFRLSFRPFEDSRVLQGVVEFNIRPVEGSVAVQAGSQTEPWDPLSDNNYKIINSAFSISLTPGLEATAAGKPLETDSITMIESGRDYRLTIKWDLEGGTPMVRLFLNGEPVRVRGQSGPLNLKFAADPADGTNAFRISLGSSENKLGKVFIGPIVAASGSKPDMEQAEDPLLKP